MFVGIIDASGHTGASGIFRDVTARKALDAQLRDSIVVARHAAEQSERAARTDELTGLPNRRAFFEMLGARLAEAHPIALAVFDVDHFKRINDSLGHPAGDEVLRRIASVTSAALRADDMVARIGGEEFAIILDGTAAKLAESVAERVIRTIAAERINIPAPLCAKEEGVGIDVTVSMGLAHAQPVTNATELLGAADRALYAAKRGGRNCLRLAA